MLKRVVVTGLGVVSPLGNSVEETWEGVKAGKSGIGPITKFSTEGFSSRIGGEVRNFAPEQWMPVREAAHSDPFLHFAIAGATMAIQDSGILSEPNAGERIGTCIATASGGLNVLTKQHAILMEKGPRQVSPLTVPFTICDMGSGYVSIVHKLEGPNHSLVSACASGASAIGEGYYIIQRGHVDAMVVGASDAIVPLHLAAFASARALTSANEEPTKASRPFDRDRSGFVMAEGSAIMVIEEYEHAKARGAKIYAELVGYGSCSDAHHITAPDPSGKGAVRAMREAIQMAGLTAGDIQYVNAHATSTPLGDKVEVGALKQIFGSKLPHLPVSSTKSMTGHMIGAAGSVEAVFCILAMRDGVLPPTINQDNLDPECDIDTIPNVARNISTEFTLTNSFGFGGHNVSLLFKRLDE